MRFLLILSVFFIVAFLQSCDNDSTPKPRSFIRIDFPKPEYLLFDSTYPFQFEYSDKVKIDFLNRQDHPFWMNLNYPDYNARIYLTYNNIQGNINQMLSDAHEMAYTHISVASDIQTEIIYKSDIRVFGLYYYIKGDKVASPINFFVTDSLQHFLRGSLYFNEAPSNDSLSPVIEGINTDLWHLINTLKWKNQSK